MVEIGHRRLQHAECTSAAQHSTMPHPGFLVGGEEMHIFVGDPLALHERSVMAVEKRKEGRKEGTITEI